MEMYSFPPLVGAKVQSIGLIGYSTDMTYSFFRLDWEPPRLTFVCARRYLGDVY